MNFSRTARTRAEKFNFKEAAVADVIDKTRCIYSRHNREPLLEQLRNIRYNECTSQSRA